MASSRHALRGRVTSTQQGAHLALRLTQPPEPSSRTTTVLSIRSCASQMARLLTSVLYSLLKEMPADMQTPPHRINSARTHTAGLQYYMISQARAMTLLRLRAEASAVLPWADSTMFRSQTGLL